MKIAIMQPYFLPYIGYFQLIKAVDVFVIYDNIEFTKKGWIHRNRLLNQGEAKLFTIPLKKDSDFLHVNQRYLSDDFEQEKNKLLRLVKNNYQRAPYFNAAYAFFERVLNYEDPNLFNFIYHAIVEACKFLDIDTKLVVSSTLKLEHSLKSKDKVLEICRYQKATHYYNPEGGIELYKKNEFSKAGIQLNFIKSKPTSYLQFNEPFVPCLSVLDLMMFNNKEDICDLLDAYELI